MFSKWPMHNVIKSCVDLKKKAIESKTQSKVIIVTEYEKFIDMTLDSTLQLTFKKLPLDNFYSLFTFYSIFVIIAIVCLQSSTINHKNRSASILFIVNTCAYESAWHILGGWQVFSCMNKFPF